MIEAESFSKNRAALFLPLALTCLPTPGKPGLAGPGLGLTWHIGIPPSLGILRQCGLEREREREGRVEPCRGGKLSMVKNGGSTRYIWKSGTYLLDRRRREKTGGEGAHLAGAGPGATAGARAAAGALTPPVVGLDNTADLRLVCSHIKEDCGPQMFPRGKKIACQVAAWLATSPYKGDYTTANRRDYQPSLWA